MVTITHEGFTFLPCNTVGVAERARAEERKGGKENEKERGIGRRER